MTFSQAMLGCAGALGILVALAHSILGERDVFGPLKAGAEGGAILGRAKYRRLFWVFWHFPSLVWALLGVLALGEASDQWSMGASLYVAIAAFSASGLVNLWANRSVHLGWVLLFATAALLAGGKFFQG